MIRSLRKMMKYAYISPCNDCCRHDCFFIKRAVNYLRTGKCEKNSSGFYLPECFYVQALVAHQCIVAYIKMFGKGGRIKHHHIEFIFTFFSASSIARFELSTECTSFAPAFNA